MVRMFITYHIRKTERSRGCMKSVLYLDDSIDFSGRVVTIRTSADQHGSVPTHQSKRKPLEEVPGSLALLLASVSGKSSSQHLDLGHGDLVQSSQGFHGNGDE